MADALDTSLKLKLLHTFCDTHLSSSIQLLQKRWDTLITENTRKLARSHYHLQFDNRLVLRSGESDKFLPRWDRNRIHPDYLAELKEVLAYEAEVKKDHSMLSSFMTTVLNRSSCVADIYSMIPTGLHDPLYRVKKPPYGETSTKKLPPELMKYHDQAIAWIEVQNVRNFLLGN